MGKAIDLVGRTFGRLAVLAANGRDAKGRLLWLCRCECGSEKTVLGLRLREGFTKSYGCAWAERKANMGALMLSKHQTHGLSRTPTHKTWDGMMQRCTNENHEAYGRYGGAGVVVCERWARSFAAFVEDMGIRPAGKTLDRIDGAKGYEPSNCKWSTKTEQARNTRSNKLNAAIVLEIRRLHEGGTLQQEIAERFGVQQPTISKVLRRQRWADIA